MNAAVRDKASAAFGSQTSVESTPETSHVMHLYCRFCSDVSVAQEDSQNSLMKMIVLFQKNISTDVAYQALFSHPGAAFLDWEHLPQLKNDRGYSDSTTWVGVMKYLQVSVPDMKSLVKNHPIFAHYADCLHKTGLKVDPTEFVCLYLLVNITRLDSLHVFEQYFSLTRNKNTRQEGLVFFSQLANTPFDRDVQTKALVSLIKNHCSIRSGLVTQELEIMQLKSKELEGLFKQKQMRAVIGRPKLRSKLKGRDGTVTSMFQIDRMGNWSNVIRFPNVFSLTQKKRLYFVMSQVYMDPNHYVRTLLLDREISETVVKYPVKAPDVEVIFECIAACRITTEPFPELHQFRAECFHSFAHEQKTKLRLNDLLHLYIAAYQAPSIWKAVWKLVFPVLSIQIIRDVESFVERTPFTHENVVSLMFGKTVDELHTRLRPPVIESTVDLSPSSYVESRPISPSISIESRPISPSISIESRPISPSISIESRPISPSISIESRPIIPIESISPSSYISPATTLSQTTASQERMDFEADLEAYELSLQEDEEMLLSLQQLKLQLATAKARQLDHDGVPGIAGQLQQALHTVGRPEGPLAESVDE